MMKKMIAIVLMSIMVLSGTVMSFAENNNTFMFRDLYLNKNTAEVLDKSGNDITKDFFSATERYFKNSNYEAIKSYASDNISQFSFTSKEVELDSPNIKADLRSKYVEKRFHKYVNALNGNLPQKEIGYYVGGIITYDQNTDQVVSTSDVECEVFFYGLGAAFDPYETNKRTEHRVSSGRGYFYGSFRLYAGFMSPEGFPTVTYDFGTCSGQFYATP